MKDCCGRQGTITWMGPGGGGECPSLHLAMVQQPSAGRTEPLTPSGAGA